MRRSLTVTILGGAIGRSWGLWLVYRRDAVNLSHVLALNVSVLPSRFTVSRTRIMPSPLAVSTQSLPAPPE
jgi:hypothetical protein